MSKEINCEGDYTELGRITKGDPRDIWKHEAYDFTKWLAKEENLGLLSEELGIRIKLIGTEANVGKYAVDILAEDENTGKKIIIENQLEYTDHDHLGKIITYASGYDAEIIIWIAKDANEEHRQAVDWLNEHTDEALCFFLIKVELWRINESPYAPKFHIISQPNNWVKIIRASPRGLSEANLMQLDFWSKFKSHAEEKKVNFRLKMPNPLSYYYVSINRPGETIALVMSIKYKFIRCEIYITGPKEIYYGHYENKDEIEKQMGEKLVWQELPGKTASRIHITKENVDVTNKEIWEECFDWFILKAEKFQEVFGKY